MYLGNCVDARDVWKTQVAVDVKVIGVLFTSWKGRGEAGHRGVGHAESFLQTLLKSTT